MKRKMEDAIRDVFETGHEKSAYLLVDRVGNCRCVYSFLFLHEESSVRVTLARYIPRKAF